MREKCAVFGIFSEEKVFNQIYLGLYSLQHRGQESAGIAIYSTAEKKILMHKDMGLVPDVFKNVNLEGNSGIGHVRYSTCGSSVIENSQPIIINYAKGSFSIAHNGNLVNYKDLRETLERKGCVFSTNTDTEIIAQLFAQEHIKTRGDLIEGIKNAMKLLEGAYSLTILTDEGQVLGIRDPWGIRPLILGKHPLGYVIASETCALDTLGMDFVRDVKPGEIICIDENGLSSDFGRKENSAHCMFEYVYFSRPDSFINGISVYDVRKNLGKNLWEEKPTKADIVIAVPDSGITAAIGYSQVSNIKYSEGLMKNRYTGRTFIMPEQKDRELNVKVKLNPISSEVSNKEVILIDDSIVRGNTMRNLVSLLRNAGGAKKVHVRISCPPIKHPCFYGIDMQTHKEFIASEKSVDDIGKQIGADSLKYNSIEALIRAIGLPREKLCLACLTGEYPIKEKQLKLKI